MPGGAPVGNTNAIRGRIWRDSIKRALEKRADQSRVEWIQELDKLAERLLTAADAGDMAAMRELGDRLEGKPAQQIQVQGDADAPLKIVHESR